MPCVPVKCTNHFISAISFSSACFLPWGSWTEDPDESLEMVSDSEEEEASISLISSAGSAGPVSALKRGVTGLHPPCTAVIKSSFLDQNPSSEIRTSENQNEVSTSTPERKRQLQSFARTLHREVGILRQDTPTRGQKPQKTERSATERKQTRIAECLLVILSSL